MSVQTPIETSAYARGSRVGATTAVPFCTYGRKEWQRARSGESWTAIRKCRPSASPLLTLQIPRYASGYKDHRKHLRFCVKPTEPDFSASFLALDSNGSRSGGGHPVSEVDNLSDTQEVDTDVEDDAQTGRQQMEGHLARHPADVESWITYSKAHWTNGRGHRKAELDVSLAILSRAIRSESLGWSVPLHLEYLRISAELWPFQRVDEAWKALLRQSDAEGSGISSSDHFELRLGYLDWIQGAGFGQGDYDGDGVMAVLEDALCSDRLHGQSGNI